MGSEFLGFGVFISALSISADNAKQEGLTFGLHRAEVVGTLLQITTLWVLIGWMLIEAIDRFQDPMEIQTDVMLTVSIMSFIFNLM